MDDGGWTAEYRIPFSQLRFRDAPEQVWGIQLERIIGRRQEYAVLSFTPKSEPGGIPTYGNLVGLENIEPGNRLEVLPYAVARSEHVDPGANPFRSSSEHVGVRRRRPALPGDVGLHPERQLQPRLRPGGGRTRRW